MYIGLLPIACGIPSENGNFETRMRSVETSILRIIVWRCCEVQLGLLASVLLVFPVIKNARLYSLCAAINIFQLIHFRYIQYYRWSCYTVSSCLVESLKENLIRFIKICYQFSHNTFILVVWKVTSFVSHVLLVGIASSDIHYTT